MGNKNYTKYSENSNNNTNVNFNNDSITPETPVTSETPVTPELPEVQNNPEVITTPEEITNPVTPEEPADPETNLELENNDQNKQKAVEPKLGVIVGCTMLNMRKEPSKDSDVVTILSKSDSVQVYLDESTEDFYKVRIVDKEGYCVKDFIEIK